MVLGGGRRGPGHRVRRALARDRRPLARAGVGDVVRRRQAQHRVELRPPLGRRATRRRRSGLSRRGRRAALADVRGAVARGDAARGGARRDSGWSRATAWRRTCRCRRRPPIASHACAHIGAVQVPDLLGLRSTRGRAATPGLRGEGRDHRRGVARDAAARCRCSRSLEEARREAPALEHVVLAPFDERHRRVSRARSSRSPSTRSTRTSSRTRPARRASRRASLHVQGGFLVSIAREVCYQADARPGDVLHFATDMGWIMGPWTVVGGGAMGATIVYAEGAPDWPPDRLWQTVEEERVTILGCSPTLVRALMPHGDPSADLSSLRIFVTTGEPWNPDPYRWLFERVGGGRCPIINCSGGTEVGACFLSPTPATPIKECSLGGPALGMAMDVVDDDGPLARRHGRGRRARLPQAVPRHDARLLARPRAVSRHVLAPLSRRSGRTATGRRSTRTATGTSTAARTTRSTSPASASARPSSSRRRSGTRPWSEAAAVGVPHEVKGEVAWVFCVLAPGRDASSDARSGRARAVAGELGKAFAPERVAVRRRAAEDALGEDRAPRRPRDGARRGPRRHVVGREPRGARRHRRPVID